jgi:hypothetical protein
MKFDIRVFLEYLSRESSRLVKIGRKMTDSLHENPGGGEISRTCPDRPWSPPSFLYNGYRVFPGTKERPGRDPNPSPPSSAVIKKG